VADKLSCRHDSSPTLLGPPLSGLGLGLTRVGIVGSVGAPVERGITAGLITASAQLGITIGPGLLTSVTRRLCGADSEQLAAWHRAAFLGGAGFAVISTVTAPLARGRVAPLQPPRTRSTLIEDRDEEVCLVVLLIGVQH
jgi:hypothetical protein